MTATSPHAGQYLAATDSARVAGDVYGLSLVATVPILLAAVALLLLRHSNAGARAVMWRCALISLLIICAGRLIPWQWMAWILPEPLARPLVALGTLELDRPPETAAGSSLPIGALDGLLALYAAGVAFILIRTVVARSRLWFVRQRAIPMRGAKWHSRLREAGQAVGVSTAAVRLLCSPCAPVPMTWGVRRPVILLPSAALRWPAGRVQAVLRHELAHVGAHDAATRLVARLTCALLWFHPGTWWLVRRFERDVEEAADDRVVLSGVRASDYAEWLAASASGTSGATATALALVHPGNLRSRLARLTGPRRRIAVPGRHVALAAFALTAIGTAPLATARLAPTRDVLTSLMQEARWESRAWAVVRLAQRADSVDVARSAAHLDPDPSVRAWARYALARSPDARTTRPGS
jgi:beta-lactamase regulating signal transducer with metallopeptidase domain